MWVTTDFQSPQSQAQHWTLRPAEQPFKNIPCLLTHTDVCCVYKQNMWKHIQAHIMWFLAHPGWRVRGSAGGQQTWSSALQLLQKTVSRPAINTQTHAHVFQLHISKKRKKTVPQGWLSLFVPLRRCRSRSSASDLLSRVSKCLHCFLRFTHRSAVSCFCLSCAEARDATWQATSPRADHV